MAPGGRRTLAKLSVISNGIVKKTVELGAGELYIGRGDDVSIQLKHPLISRKHARLYLTPAGYIIEDQGTKNGTFVAGQRVQRHRLVDGDRVEIADFILHYHADGFVPVDDQIPPPGVGLVGRAHQAEKKLSPLEAYMAALKRGGANATAAIPPEAMARLREQAKRKATPRLQFAGGEPAPFEAEVTTIGFGDGVDLSVGSWWFWIKEAARLERKNLQVVLHRKTKWVTIKINGVKIKEAQMVIEFGDTIEVGGTPIRLLEGDIGF
jgi:hypothetical protein